MDLFSLSEYKSADIVLSYASFRSEVITDSINQRIIDDGKELFLPKTYKESGEMIFYEVSSLDSLKSGYMGIREPAPDDSFRFSPSDNNILIIMPGVAYDDEGNRLGYGGGYYDRFLSSYPDLISHTIMLAFSEQFVELIPTENTDIKPSMIISE